MFICLRKVTALAAWTNKQLKSLRARICQQVSLVALQFNDPTGEKLDVNKLERANQPSCQETLQVSWLENGQV